MADAEVKEDDSKGRVQVACKEEQAISPAELVEVKQASGVTFGTCRTQLVSQTRKRTSTNWSENSLSQSSTFSLD